MAHSHGPSQVVLGQSFSLGTWHLNVYSMILAIERSGQHSNWTLDKTQSK